MEIKKLVPKSSVSVEMYHEDERKSRSPSKPYHTYQEPSKPYPTHQEPTKPYQTHQEPTKPYQTHQEQSVIVPSKSYQLPSIPPSKHYEHSAVAPNKHHQHSIVAPSQHSHSQSHQKETKQKSQSSKYHHDPKPAYRKQQYKTQTFSPLVKEPSSTTPSYQGSGSTIMGKPSFTKRRPFTTRSEGQESRGNKGHSGLDGAASNHRAESYSNSQSQHDSDDKLPTHEVKNTRWKALSESVEISESDEPKTKSKRSRRPKDVKDSYNSKYFDTESNYKTDLSERYKAESFDHDKALKGSSPFGISNVVSFGETEYKPEDFINSEEIIHSGNFNGIKETDSNNFHQYDEKFKPGYFGAITASKGPITFDNLEESQPVKKPEVLPSLTSNGFEIPLMTVEEFEKKFGPIKHKKEVPKKTQFKPKLTSQRVPLDGRYTEKRPQYLPYKEQSHQETLTYIEKKPQFQPYKEKTLQKEFQSYIEKNPQFQPYKEKTHQEPQSYSEKKPQYQHYKDKTHQEPQRYSEKKPQHQHYKDKNHQGAQSYSQFNRQVPEWTKGQVLNVPKKHEEVSMAPEWAKGKQYSQNHEDNVPKWIKNKQHQQFEGSSNTPQWMRNKGAQQGKGAPRKEEEDEGFFSTFQFPGFSRRNVSLVPEGHVENDSSEDDEPQQFSVSASYQIDRSHRG